MLSPNLLQPDKLIHEPARLAILTVLSTCASADFIFLQTVTGLSKGNLSVQLSKLEEADLVKIEKLFVGKKPNTTASLTEKGCQALADYWVTMDQIRRHGQAVQNGKKLPGH